MVFEWPTATPADFPRFMYGKTAADMLDEHDRQVAEMAGEYQRVLDELGSDATISAQ